MSETVEVIDRDHADIVRRVERARKSQWISAPDVDDLAEYLQATDSLALRARAVFEEEQRREEIYTRAGMEWMQAHQERLDLQHALQTALSFIPIRVTKE